MPVLVLLGAPGAGKGTQAPLLAASLGVPVLASGELLRAEVASGSEIGREVDAIMRSGELVPDDLMARLFLARLGRDDAAQGAILDGFPRTRGRRPRRSTRRSAPRAGASIGRCSSRFPSRTSSAASPSRLICRERRPRLQRLVRSRRGVWGICDLDGSRAGPSRRRRGGDRPCADGAAARAARGGRRSTTASRGVLVAGRRTYSRSKIVTSNLLDALGSARRAPGDHAEVGSRDRADARRPAASSPRSSRWSSRSSSPA